MKNWVLGVLLLVFAGHAIAQETGSVTLSWTPPTENVDGSPLTDLAGYNIYHGMQDGGPYPLSINVDDPAAVSWVVDNLIEGTHYFVATAYNEADVESEYSEQAAKVVTVPLPPGGVAGTGDSAYIITQSEDTLVLLDVGTINADTQCSAETVIVDDNGITAYKVPTSAVTPYSSGQELVVTFSQCGN